MFSLYFVHANLPSKARFYQSRDREEAELFDIVKIPLSDGRGSDTPVF
jgi:hypothetical protein